MVDFDKILNSKVKLDDSDFDKYKNIILKGFYNNLNISFSNDFLKKWNDNLKGIYYVENLEYAAMAYFPSINSIIIDKKYTHTSNGKTEIIKNDAIDTMLVHEILHSMSNEEYRNGLPRTEYNSSSCFALNEGITELFKNEILGTKQSNSSTFYTLFLLMSYILKETIGIIPIVKSYFLGTNDMEDEINKVIGNENYYSYLVDELAKNLNYALYNEGKGRKIIITTYDNKNQILLSSVILNIVLPKYKSLDSKEKREEYITNIIKELAIDSKSQNQFITYFKSIINYSDTEIQGENENLYNSIKECNKNQKFIASASTDKKEFFVTNDGDIIGIATNKKVTNKMLKKDIYLLLNKNNPEIRESSLENLYNVLKDNDATISIEGKTKLETLKKYVEIDNYLVSRNVKLLNNIDEIDKNDVTLELKCIRIEDNKLLSLNDLKKLSDNFEIVLENGSEKIIDRKTKLEPDSDYINYNIKFINKLQEYFKSQKLFSNNGAIIYNRIKSYIENQYQASGELGINGLISVAIEIDEKYGTNIVGFINELKYNPEEYDRLSLICAFSFKNVVRTKKEVYNKIDIANNAKKEARIIEEDYQQGRSK